MAGWSSTPEDRSKGRTGFVVRAPSRGRHTPGGHTARTLRTHGRPPMKRSGDHQKPRRVGMTLPPAAGAGTGLMGRGISNVLSYRYATRPEPSHTGYSTTKVAASRAIKRPDGAPILRIPFQYGCGRPQELRTATYKRFRWSEPVWSPPPESNRRPHPYHGTTGNRCANRHIPSLRPTVRAKVIGSLAVRLCVLLESCRDGHWSRPSSL